MYISTFLYSRLNLCLAKCLLTVRHWMDSVFLDLEKLSKLTAVIQILNLIIFGGTEIEARLGFSFSSSFLNFTQKFIQLSSTLFQVRSWAVNLTLNFNYNLLRSKYKFNNSDR